MKEKLMNVGCAVLFIACLFGAFVWATMSQWTNHDLPKYRKFYDDGKAGRPFDPGTYWRPK